MQYLKSITKLICTSLVLGLLTLTGVGLQGNLSGHSHPVSHNLGMSTSSMHCLSMCQEFTAKKDEQSDREDDEDDDADKEKAYGPYFLQFLPERPLVLVKNIATTGLNSIIDKLSLHQLCCVIRR